jgi:AraC-like DNA-binding protein
VISPIPSELLSITFADNSESRREGYFWDNRARGVERLALVQQTGEGTCFFAYGGQRYLVRRGEAFLSLMPEPSSYGLPEEPAMPPYQPHYINFRGSEGMRLLEHLRQLAGPVVPLHRWRSAQAEFDELIACFQKKTFGNRFSESARIYRFFMLCLQEHFEDLQGRDPLERARGKILHHYQQAFNIKELAAELGYSREHLTRRFRERYGQSPASLLRKTRVACARRLMAAGVRDLNTLARAAGFTTPRTAARALAEETD